MGTRTNAGLPAAVVQLIEDNLLLVGSIVREVSCEFPRHVDRGELTQAGYLGLVEAAKRFDPGRSVSFHRFAARRVRGAILDAARRADWAPRSVRQTVRSMRRTEQRLALRMGRLPSTAELAAELGVSEGKVLRAQQGADRAVLLCLDRARRDDDYEGATLLETLQDCTADDAFDRLESIELRSYVRDAVAALPDLQREVILGLYIDGFTTAQVGRRVGLTASRVSQIRVKALSVLRSSISAQYAEPRGTEVVEAA
jgi:RNA polymerase sigma factor for flagellar operon FliA